MCKPKKSRKRGSRKILVRSRNQKRFWWVSKSRFRGILVLEVSNFVADGSRGLVFVVFSFRLVLKSRDFQSSWVNTAYYQTEVESLKQEKWLVYWWASTRFHWRLGSIYYLALFVPLSWNFRHLVSGSRLIKTFKFWNQGLAIGVSQSL